MKDVMQKRYALRDKVGPVGLGAGAWSLGPGGDPFGGPTREAIPIIDRLPLLAEAGLSNYEAHDQEVPAADAEKARAMAASVGLKCAMYTPSFCADTISKDGGITSNDPKVRTLASDNAKRAVDSTVALGAKVMVFPDDVGMTKSFGERAHGRTADRMALFVRWNGRCVAPCRADYDDRLLGRGPHE